MLVLIQDLFQVMKGYITECLKRVITLQCDNTLKPIFHQNAKLLALGTFASPNAKDKTFALPNARNTNMLVSLALGDANFLHRPCTFHFFGVDFFALGSKRKPHFQWYIGCVGYLALAFGMYTSCVR